MTLFILETLFSPGMQHDIFFVCFLNCVLSKVANTDQKLRDPLFSPFPPQFIEYYRSLPSIYRHLLQSRACGSGLN